MALKIVVFFQMANHGHSSLNKLMSTKKPARKPGKRRVPQFLITEEILQGALNSTRALINATMTHPEEKGHSTVIVILDPLYTMSRRAPKSIDSHSFKVAVRAVKLDGRWWNQEDRPGVKDAQRAALEQALISWKEQSPKYKAPKTKPDDHKVSTVHVNGTIISCCGLSNEGNLVIAGALAVTLHNLTFKKWCKCHKGRGGCCNKLRTKKKK